MPGGNGDSRTEISEGVPPYTDNGVVLRTPEEQTIYGIARHVGRFRVVVDIPGELLSLRLSESVPRLAVTLRGRCVYDGRGVIQTLVPNGPSWVCEVGLEESSWRVPAEMAPDVYDPEKLGEAFADFLRDWSQDHQLLPGYKSVISDMHTFLVGLRLWLDQLQVQLSLTNGKTLSESRAVQLLETVGRRAIPCIDELFRRFEECCTHIPTERVQAHRCYMRRQLHPLTLCAPFAHRTFFKPLGYAGDYEMVNMIVRNGWEGESLYARVVNKWFLEQPPAEAHRNRISYLTGRLLEEALRVAARGRGLRVLNLACGPAHEVQRFIAECPLSSDAEITLLDMDGETLRHVEERTALLTAQHHRKPKMRFVRESVFQLLKSAESKRCPVEARFDLAYCAGLFDYLPDAVCKRLVSYMFHRLDPGGLLIATNVHPCNPLRNGMEHLLDWHLICRDAPQMRELAALVADQGDVRVLSDPTGVNVFLEVRKPAP